MARHARKISYTDFYHVMVRGNNKEDIFVNSFDKKAYLKKLIDIEKEGLIELAGWCVMDNHVHLLVRAELVDLSLAMKMLNTKYAMRINLKYDGVGHVFQNRFKSEVIYSDEHLLMVLRYIHQNPVKANLTKNVASYSWSSYHTYSENDGHNARGFIKSLFDDSQSEYKAFHQLEDDGEYLDIKEDIDKQRMSAVINIIVMICKQHDLTPENFYSSKNVCKEIALNLYRKTEISKHKIAKIIKRPYSTVRNWTVEWDG